MDWAQAVREVIEEARRTAGGGAAFAELLERVGVPAKGGRYSESGITNWIKGRTSPDGAILLATAAIAGISLDQKIAQLQGKPDSSTAEGRDVLRQEAEELRQRVEQLQEAVAKLETDGSDLRELVGLIHAQLIDLSAKVGYPALGALERSGQQRRAASG